MRRFNGTVLGDNIILDDSSMAHFKVVRIKENEQFEVLDNSQAIFLCRFKDGKICVQERLHKSHELPGKLSLLYCMPKGDKFELVVQKATELGVTDIYPLNSKFVIKRMDKETFKNKLARYNKIADEAKLQCNREKSVIIHELLDIKEIENLNFKTKLVAYENMNETGKVIDESLISEDVAILVGAEGGLSEDEVSKLLDLGYNKVSLGKRILRSETAAIYSISLLSYLIERYIK